MEIYQQYLETAMNKHMCEWLNQALLLFLGPGNKAIYYMPMLYIPSEKISTVFKLLVSEKMSYLE